MNLFRNSFLRGSLFVISGWGVLMPISPMAPQAWGATLQPRPALTGSVTSPAASTETTQGRPELPVGRANAKSSHVNVNNERGEEIAVDQIHERYWAQGREVEVGVVQNRIYSKRKKFELAVSGAKLNGDPFLTTNTIGGSFGFHFSEYLSLHAIGWKAYTANSSALTTLIAQTNATTDTNPVKSFFGGEARASVLYGKLSLVGKLILYFDANLSAGVGSIDTFSGKDLAYHLGIGQQIHVSHLFSINIDYRFLYYKETLLRAVASQTTPVGGFAGTRSNLSGLTTLSVSLFLDFF